MSATDHLLTVTSRDQDRLVEALVINNDITEAEAREAVKMITRLFEPIPTAPPIQIYPETLARCEQLLVAQTLSAQRRRQ